MRGMQKQGTTTIEFIHNQDFYHGLKKLFMSICSVSRLPNKCIWGFVGVILAEIGVQYVDISEFKFKDMKDTGLTIVDYEQRDRMNVEIVQKYICFKVINLLRWQGYGCKILFAHALEISNDVYCS